jgi:hypothetical protein
MGRRGEGGIGRFNLCTSPAGKEIIKKASSPLAFLKASMFVT